MVEIHLRRLLQENILRVEKENWDLISKEIEEENAKKPGRILKETQVIADFSVTESPSWAKNIANKPKVKPLRSSSHAKSVVNSSLCTLDSTIQSREEPTKQSTCCDGHFEMHRMHFLNHYQYQLQQQQWGLQKRHSACAIPLTQPIQKDVHFRVEKLQKSSKKEINKENNHHFVHDEGTRKLTIQKLPSITVCGKNRKANISFEEITEYNEGIGCAMKTFCDDSTKISPPFHNIRNASEPFLSERNMNRRVCQPEKTKFPENINNSQAHIDRNLLKALVKEILEESESSSNRQLPLESSKENGCSSTKSYQSSYSESFRKREQKCNCHMYARNTLHTQTEEATVYSTVCQTDSPDKLKVDSLSLRNLIEEVISEYHSFPPAESDMKSTHKELNSPVDSQREEKGVQANIPTLKRADKYYLSKETQVSMWEKNDSHQSKLDCSECRKMDENKSKNEASNLKIEQQLATVTSKVEYLTNVFSNQVTKKNELFAERLLESSSRNNKQPIHTRDVSLQFSPYLVNKSTYTYPIRTLEKANQCDSQTQKQYFNVSTQAVPEPLFRKTATVFTQADYKTILTTDTWVQTEEVNTNAPEHSNNSSVAVTPVSDSPFLDDVLSEGEIPLHLKFLTFHDHAAYQNSTVAGSSEEKDYSLSEGEIHPRYLQSSYDLPLGKAQLCTSCCGLKPHTEKNTVLEGSFSEVNYFHQEQNMRRIESSTPIQNNYRNSFQFHSHGELSFHSSNKMPSCHDNRQMVSREKDSNNCYRYRSGGYQVPDKIPSPSNLSSLSSLDNSN